MSTTQAPQPARLLEATAASPAPSRRAILGGLAATSAAVALPALTASPAEAATAYRPARYNKTPVPTAAARHMGNRFAYGMTPALAREMQRAGGPQAWFRKQLNPGSIRDAFADETHKWWYSIDASASTLWDREVREIEGGWEAMANYARWCMVRRIYSKRQVLELMTEFWENHLYVPIHDDGVFTYRAAYGKMIRNRALGAFDDLLVAATTHPAMGISLDNAQSNKWGVNENLGRELLELHTVGQGNYTEDDVKASARILTGYRVETWSTWKAYYDESWHVTGPVKVMGFSHPNGSSDGRAVAEAYLRYLARHPKTAEKICRKLAQRFVSDTPSAALVSHLASVYLKNGTQIKPVLLALVKSKEFAASAGDKVRTPTDDVIATYRAMRVKIARPTNDEACANAILWQASALGHQPFGWTRPDGPPDNAVAWTSVSRMLASFEMHWGMSGGWWPSIDVRRPSYLSWIPNRSRGGVRFDQLVDHLSRVLLGRKSTAQLLQACCQATGTRPGERINKDHPIGQWKMPWLLTTVLDTPAHLTR